MKAFVRNTVVSLFTTALDFIVLVGLVEVFGVNYVVAAFCGSVVGATSNFLINRHWSYNATGGAAHWQMVRFLPVQAGSSLLQTGGVWLFTGGFHLQYIASKLVTATLVYLVWNYPMNRYFVFPKPRERSTEARAGT
jgi:putative flippase GtrA